ncbi:MAG: sugar nucleotide-binding protein, partial [bacterium]|nr:sugar nucleotide-binding protein [bacterium]
KNPIILRPCLMYGPKTETGRGSFLQWMDEAFQQGNAVSLFRDEIRTPVFVLDVINAIAHLLTELTPFRLYHVGGPERIRRSEFGLRVAAIRGYIPELIKETQLAELSTGYPRPEDVSLDSSLIQNTFNLRLTPIGEGIRRSFGLPLEEK